MKKILYLFASLAIVSSLIIGCDTLSKFPTNTTGGVFLPQW